MPRKKKDAEETKEAEELAVDHEDVPDDRSQEEADLIHFVNSGQSVALCGLNVNGAGYRVLFVSQRDKVKSVTCKECKEGQI